MTINFEKFNELTMDDPEFASELLEIYAAQFEEYSRELPTAAQAEPETIRFLNHKIKSSVVVLGLSAFLDKQNAYLLAVDRKQTDLSPLHQAISDDCRLIVQVLLDRRKSL